jgi:hypothetical protein
MLRTDDVPVVVGRLWLPPRRLKLQLDLFLLWQFFGVHFTEYGLPIHPLICGGGGPQRGDGGY